MYITGTFTSHSRSQVLVTSVHSNKAAAKRRAAGMDDGDWFESEDGGFDNYRAPVVGDVLGYVDLDQTVVNPRR